VAGSFLPTGPALVNDTVVDVAAGQTATDAVVHTGDEVIVKTGAGTLVLDAANTHSGGLRVESGTVILRHPSALNGGPLTVAPGARVVIDTGTERIDVASLAIDSAASLDLGRAGFVVAGSGFDVSAVREAVIAGRNGGGWNGEVGITSAAAAGEAGRAVGYVVGNDGRLTVGFAAYGDIDLDGQVSAFDLIGLQSGGTFNTGAATNWQGGDFNYDGVANVLDLVAATGSGAYGRGQYNVVPSQPPAASGPDSAAQTANGMAQVAFAAATGGPQQSASADGADDETAAAGGGSVAP
jgi:fibronectin-binding autotransporter adhesin